MIRLTESLRDDLIHHARAEAPREACGLLSEGKDGIRLRIAENAAESPSDSFAIAPQEQFDLLEAIYDRKEELVGIFHSHPNGDEQPSHRDRTIARFWPGLTWVIVGLHGERALHCLQCGGDGMACCGNVLDTGECCAALYGTDRCVPCSGCYGAGEIVAEPTIFNERL